MNFKQKLEEIIDFIGDDKWAGEITRKQAIEEILSLIESDIVGSDDSEGKPNKNGQKPVSMWEHHRNKFRQEQRSKLRR